MHFDIAIIGGGIAGLTVALEMSKIIPKTNLLILEENKHLYQSASGNALGILGGHGCKSAQNPRSPFRKLLRKSLDLYPQWLQENFQNEIALKEIVFDHILLGEKDEKTSRIKKLIEEEQSKSCWRKSKEFFRQHPEIDFWANDGEKNSETDAVATFFDTLAIDARALMEVLGKNIKKNGGQIKLATKVKKITENNNFFCIDIIEEESDLQTIFCKKLVMAAGAKNASLLSQMGYRIKQYFSWGEWIDEFPLKKNAIKKDEIDISNSWRWQSQKASYLYRLVKKNPTICIAGYEKKNKWDFYPMKKKMEQWLEENTKKMQIDWVKKDFSKHYRYGMRMRTKDWMPMIGLLKENLFIASSLYKSGITLAPVIARMVQILWQDLKSSSEENEMIENIDPKRKKKILRSYTKKDDYCVYYPFS